MYTIGKTFAFSASHQLDHLPDGHPCKRLHGHNYIVELIFRDFELNNDHFVVDFNLLAPFQTYIDEKLDHRHLNDVLPCPTTSECIARHLYDLARTLWPEADMTVKVSETPKTFAAYTSVVDY